MWTERQNTKKIIIIHPPIRSLIFKTPHKQYYKVLPEKHLIRNGELSFMTLTRKYLVKEGHNSIFIKKNGWVIRRMYGYDGMDTFKDFSKNYEKK